MCAKTNCYSCGASIEVCDFEDDGHAYCPTCKLGKERRDKKNAKVVVKGADRKTILLWRFFDAPKSLQSLSTNGGDEDWLAFVPSGVSGEWDYFSIFASTSFDTGGEPQKIRVKNGTIWIGSHA